MKKKYSFILLLLLILGSFSAQAQDSKSTATSKTQESIIEGLTIYPNPTKSFTSISYALENNANVSIVL